MKAIWRILLCARKWTFDDRANGRRRFHAGKFCTLVLVWLAAAAANWWWLAAVDDGFAFGGATRCFVRRRVHRVTRDNWWCVDEGVFICARSVRNRCWGTRKWMHISQESRRMSFYGRRWWLANWILMGGREVSESRENLLNKIGTILSTFVAKYL